jgi:Stress responsive A/B Barrel Domain
MITHVVLIKLNHPSPENLESVVSRIMSLNGKIDVLKSIVAGTDIVHSPRSYDVALIAYFENRQDLETYSAHPVHVPVLEFVGSLASSIAAVDFEL